MKEKLTVWWDKDGDFLELTIGKPKKGIFVPLEDDILLRIDAITKKPIGIAFLNFSKNFKKKRKIKLPLKLTLERL
ncbi:MAG: hypothetical protein J7K98_03615 [Candidatus Aenigmarchaeota archaeon]|nr:hypothetical protein [Candidatus Aenigmarchaeota archaeon]